MQVQMDEAQIPRDMQPVPVHVGGGSTVGRFPTVSSISDSATVFAVGENILRSY